MTPKPVIKSYGRAAIELLLLLLLRCVPQTLFGGRAFESYTALVSCTVSNGGPVSGRALRPTQPFLVDWHLSIDLNLVLNVDRSAEGHAAQFQCDESD